MSENKRLIDRFRLSDVKEETVDALGGMPHRVDFYSGGRKKYRFHHFGEHRRVEVMNAADTEGVVSSSCTRCGGDTPGGEIHYWRRDWVLFGFVVRTLDGGRVYYCPDCGGTHWRRDV